jgi:hypothetical protein
MKLKEYRIPLPLTLDEYRRGQQWTENELLKETIQTYSTSIIFDNYFNEEKRLEIINEKIPLNLKSYITSSTLITHKKYHIKNQKSKFFELFFFNSKTDLILDEYAFNNWPYTLTIIENLDYSLRIFIQSYYINHHLSQFYFSLTDEQMKYLKDYEIINIAERFEEKNKDYRIDEDPTRNISRKKPNILPLQLNTKWYENWPKTQPSMCVYKLIEVILFNEKSFFTKATNKLLVEKKRISLFFVFSRFSGHRLLKLRK